MLAALGTRRDWAACLRRSRGLWDRTGGKVRQARARRAGLPEKLPDEGRLAHLPRCPVRATRGIGGDGRAGSAGNCPGDRL